MVPADISLETALEQAGALDLSDAETKFAASLPDVPAKEAMQQETSLEYRRLHALRLLGSSDSPRPGTLLDRFIHFVRPGVGRLAASDSTYRETFGHSAPYPWRATVVGVCHAGPSPGGGARPDNDPESGSSPGKR